MNNKYNIIYIHTHDSGKIFEPYYPSIKTPNYQDFVDNALIFERAFSASPTCSPSRASLLTGKMPHENGMLGLANRGFELNDYNQHLVSLLNDAGYITCLCGIQHEYGRYTNHNQGANKIGYQINLTTELIENDECDYYKWDLRNAEQVVHYLDSHDKKRPFFLSYGMFMTHRKYPKVIDNYNINKCYFPEWLIENDIIVNDYKGHLQALTYFDCCFGKVWNAIKNNELLDNTIIVVTSDHGIAFPFAKCNLNDRGLGVNFSIRVPESLNNGKRFSGLFSHIDFVPTILSLLKIENNYSGQGLDFSDSINHSLDNVRDRVYGEVNFHTSYEPMRSIRSNKYLYIKYFDDYSFYNLSNIDDSDSKDYYINTSLLGGEKSLELFYDLEKDCNQLNNLIDDASYSGIIDQFRLELYDYMVKTNDYLLDSDFKWNKNWIVNKRCAISPKDNDKIKI